MTLNFRPIYSAVALLVLGGAVATAQEPVSLDSCRRMALQNNKAIAVADAGVQAATYRHKAAKAAYFPGIDFAGTYTYNQNRIELLGENAKLPTMVFDPLTASYKYDILIGPDGPIKDPESGQYIPLAVAEIPKEAMAFDTHNVFAGAFTLTQPVFMGGQIKALNDIARYGEEIAKLVRNSAVQDIIIATDEAYWQVVSLKAKCELARNFVNLVDTLRRNVDIMMKEGVATRSDVLTVDVSYNQAQITLVKVQNGLSLSRMALAQMCGLPVNTQMTLTDESFSTPHLENRARAYTMEDVYASRQDLATLRKGISLMESKEKLALGTMLPKVAIVGAYSFSNPNVIHGFKNEFGGGFSVGATLTVPIWHWGGNFNEYRAAQADTRAQRLLLEDMEQKVDLQVQQARFSYDEAFKTYDMTLSNMQKAEENLRQAQIGFREGVLTTDDVIAAQTAWLQANSEKIDAEIGIRLCDVYLSKVLGTMEY